VQGLNVTLAAQSRSRSRWCDAGLKFEAKIDQNLLSARRRACAVKPRRSHTVLFARNYLT
jgi:hypothetical protein